MSKCPNCGYCPHCGRADHRTYPWVRPYPYTQPHPWWQQPYTITYGKPDNHINQSGHISMKHDSTNVVVGNTLQA